MLYFLAIIFVFILLVAFALARKNANDDPYQGKTPDAGGFMFKTEVKLSANPVAGRARYLLEPAKKGQPIRIQPIGSELLVASRSAEELDEHLKRGSLDLDEIANFGHTTPADSDLYEDVVFVNKPHLFCNHWPLGEANMETEWTKKYKIVRASRDIPAGEEIKHNYSAGYRRVDWFDDYMANRKSANVMQWVRTLSPQSTRVNLDDFGKH